MPFNLFKPKEAAGSTDDRAMSQLANADTVRTTETITKFVPATAGQVSAAEAQLRRRQEQQKHFFKLLDIKAQHSKLDTEANAKLFDYLTKEAQEVTQRRLARYPLKLAIQQSRLAIGTAESKLATASRQIDAQLAEQMRAAQEDAKNLLKGGKKK
ncbi:hypothetical protein IFO70_32745 [Phormidium tenue FACHB-886]|nr:hypothetical protein [Phormidium tenue FACHB-886]